MWFRYIKHLLFWLTKKSHRIVNSMYANSFVYKCLQYHIDYLSNKRTKNLFDFLSVIISERNISPQKNIIEEAEHYLCDEYSLFGSGFIHLEGNKWNVDFKTKYKWEPGKYYLEYKTVDYNTHSDVKYPWDMSRCHHMLILGEAYLMTHDDKYALKIREDINSWIYYNPFLKSINWTCAMDVAIRATNWLYAVSLIKDSEVVNEKFLDIFCNSLYQHSFFLEHNFEKGDKHSGNHYIANVCGLLHIYAALGIRDRKWKRLIHEFEREVIDQILPSGFHYEKSTSYHRLVLEMLFYTTVMLKKNGIEVSEKVNRSIVSMFHFLDDIIQPDGNIPLIGDNDNGRFLSFSSTELLDYRYLINQAAVFFNEKHIHISPSYIIETTLLMGKEVHSNGGESQTTFTNKYYPDAYLCVLRTSDSFALIHNNPVSRYYDEKNVNAYYNSHTHFDMLSFVLSLCGERIVIDPGTLCYTSSPEKRHLYRSTIMHNTIVVGGLNQQQGDDRSMFKIQQYSYPTISEYNDKEGFVGEYEYRVLAEKVYSHNRRLNLFEDVCIINDTIKTYKPEIVSSYLHFDPQISVYINDEGKVLLETPSKRLITLNVLSSKPNKISILQCSYSPSYGSEYKTQVLAIDYIDILGELEVEMKFSVIK